MLQERREPEEPSLRGGQWEAQEHRRERQDAGAWVQWEPPEPQDAEPQARQEPPELRAPPGAEPQEQQVLQDAGAREQPELRDAGAEEPWVKPGAEESEEEEECS